MTPELLPCTVGDLFVFSGIGVTILLTAITIYITMGETSKYRSYNRMIASLIFATPFYLASTFFILLYISPVLHHFFLINLAYWSIIVGTLLLTIFYAYFTLEAVWRTLKEYRIVQKIKRDSGINST